MKYKKADAVLVIYLLCLSTAHTRLLCRRYPFPLNPKPRCTMPLPISKMHFISRFLGCGLFVLLPTLSLADGSPVLRHLFLDPAIIASAEGVQLRVNPAQRRETVILPDQPWEQHMISFFLTVLDDGEKIRMWYVCRDDWGKGGQGNLAYAESIDGVIWTKPDLGVYSYKGSRANNLVGVHSLEGNVFRDGHTKDPTERYVYVTSVYKGGGFYRFTSPDGYTWKRDAEPLLPFEGDTQNVTFWDARLGKYVSFLRAWNPGDQRVGANRKVVRFETDRLDRPSGIVPARPRDQSQPMDRARDPFIRDEVPDALVCDEQDPSRTDIYNMSAQPYALDPHWYVAFPTFLRSWTPSDVRRYPGMKSHAGPAEVQFTGSYDSRIWHRYDRTAYAPPSIASPDKQNMVFMGTGMVVRGDEIWQYATEFESAHGDIEARKRKTDGVIVRYVQRVDGFVSLDTGNAGGIARTVPVRVTGRTLKLNLDTGALGEVRVGLLDLTGRPVPGFAAEECTPVEYNGTDVIVAWAKGADLSALQGQAVAVEFRSNRTKLYSFRFE